MKPVYTDNILLNIKSRIIIWSQILLQALFPLFTVFPVHAAPATTTKETTVAMPYSQELSTLASSTASGTDGAKSAATGMATSAAASSVQQWLSQFGTARVQLNVDDNGNWDDSAVDLLAPLYDNKKAVLFTQLGLRAPDGRTTGNLGMGVRTFYLENWMFGGNVFFDDDFTGKNRRVGFGAEAWTNYLKLSANTYVGTTNWHSSRDFTDYNEKPADGYDIRAEGYLPAYPQLGAKLMYEQYYGDKVALFDTDHLQSNPSAVTTGISYTPVPLVQLAVDYKRGQDSMDDTQFQVNFRYDFGHDWRYQVDPENVKTERSLAGSRYDLVERNNQIVLQYKKKDEQGVSNLNLQVTVDNSPSDGLTPNTAQVQATDKDGQPVRNAAISWTTTGSAKFASATSMTNDSGVATVNYTDTVAEAVNITATSGAVTASQNSHFNEVTVSSVTLKITKDNSVADGQTANQAQATVTDINGRAIANSKVSWSVGSPAVLKNAGGTTDANGNVTADFTSTVAGAATISVTAGDKSASGEGHFTANAATAVIDTMEVTRNNSPANGTTANMVKVTAKDSSGAPMSGVNVTLGADKGTVVFGAKLSKARAAAGSAYQTDAQGSLTVGFTDTVAESVVLTATLDNGNAKTASASFVADSSTAGVGDLTTTSGALANGIATNQATVTVVDTNNNPLPNVEVTWSQDGSAVLGTSAKTDASGKTSITFTDKKAETVNITATINGGSSLSKPSTFVADSSTARVSDLAATSGALANGSATNQATVTVVDTNNNPLPNVEVTWSQDGSAVLGTSAKTDASGKTTVTFTDTKAETVNITATVSGGSSLTKASKFVADSGSSKVNDLTVTTGALANGIATNQATVTVVDANNNPLPDAEVTWSQDGSAVLGTSAKTDADGKATVKFTDTKAETVNVKATVASGDSLSKPSEFIADVSTAKLLSLTVTKDGSSINGTDANTAEAIVVDANNNPLAGQTVQWSSDKTTVTLTPTNGGVSDANGKATVSYTDTVSESLTLTATINGSVLSKPSSFTDDAIIASISPTTNNVLGDGSQTNEVTVIVKNAAGQALSGKNIHWTVSTSTASLQSSATVTGGDGSSSVKLTDTEGEAVTVTATLDNGQSDGTTVTFTKVLVLSLTSASGPGGYQNLLTVTATVQDKHNQPVSGVAVNWDTTSNDLLVTSSSGNTTNSNGQAVFQFESKVVSNFSPVASIQSGTAVVSKSTSLSYTADYSAPIIYSVTPDATSLSAAELSNGFSFVVQPWKGMVKGQDIDCQYNYTSGRILDDVVVSDDNWGKATTLVTQAFPSTDAPTSGQRFCGYLTLSGSLGQRSAQTTVNVSR
ncbi:inverse autotransporter beta-barrel domain-containing protein [Citrobacter youngae]|uniref:Conserved repeat protein n=1 Tax=Citrobacter youngae ATCC 29220 TaxID=500640 RepID=D4BAQ2_9ENTR|nr:inverse autotransporter beta-barrel domain-containing protein [Citrobacter youngae]EFE09263.1 conserved repeat protein [Citrobacter youngae ATCC 29220]